MFTSARPLGAASLVVCACFGCGCVKPHDNQRANAPPQGDSENPGEISEYFAYHHDQGLLADCSIADLHFIPHSVHLSGTGEARLARYAELLGGDGGLLHYQTSECDEDLVEARLAVARSYLAKSSSTGKPVHVVLGLPGGRGMSAAESSAGQAVARQPEQRGSAYRLAESGGSMNGE
ncbi:MAG TPA: hypothetical protein VNT79_16070 [Phycisphaerae bacterium]|nr:hypothetical protein [Phycisphaerae bacterium]